MYSVKITQAIAFEFQTRDVFSFCWDAGVYLLDEKTSIDMRADALYNADEDGPDLDAPTRKAYKALLKQFW